MEENHYEAPKSDITTKTDNNSNYLASRGSRLGASLIDSVIMMIIIMPIMYGVGWFDILMSGEQPPFLYTLGLGALGLFLFVIINFKTLSKNGQTIGKKIVGIKIVDMNGDKADLKKHILKRYLAYFLPNQVPVVGSIFQFINIIFIFRKDKRCIHDLIGGTQVVPSK